MPVPMTLSPALEAGRQEQVERLPLHLSCLIAKDALRTLVEKEDTLIRIQHDHRILDNIQGVC